MSVAGNIASALAVGFDAIRKALHGANAKLILLKEDGGAKAFDVVETLGSAWLPEFSEFFGTTTFQVADVTEEFGAKVRRTSHLIVVNSDNAALNNALFEVVEGTQPPLGAEAYWKIRAKSTSRRIPTPA